MRRRLERREGRKKEKEEKRAGGMMGGVIGRQDRVMRRESGVGEG